MAEQEKKQAKYEGVRIYPDKKKRLERVRRQREIVEDRNITEISLLDEILDRELPKFERKYGISQ